MLSIEKKYLPQEDIGKGPIAEKWLTPLFAGGFLFLLTIALGPLSGFNLYELLTCTLIAALLARLIALDAIYLVLPNIYTYPLIILGLFCPTWLGWHSLTESLIGGAVGFAIPFIFALLLSLFKRSTMLGGGDIKLMSAAGAWLGAYHFPFFVTIACFITLALTFKHKTQELSFGPGLCLSFWLFVFYQKTFYSLLESLSAFITSL